MVDLFINGQKERWLVHRLIASIYIDNPKNKPEINHINQNIQDNRVENLEWATRKENLKHMISCGGSYIRNFNECKLYYKNKLIGSYGSINQACREAERLGCSYSSLNKYRKTKGFEIIKEGVTTIPKGSKVEMLPLEVPNALTSSRG